jgi:hypothetical protein
MREDLSRVQSQYFFDRYSTVCAGRRGTEQVMSGVALKFQRVNGVARLVARAELAFTED